MTDVDSIIQEPEAGVHLENKIIVNNPRDDEDDGTDYQFEGMTLDFNNKDDETESPKDKIDSAEQQTTEEDHRPDLEPTMKSEIGINSWQRLTESRPSSSDSSRSSVSGSSPEVEQCSCEPEEDCMKDGAEATISLHEATPSERSVQPLEQSKNLQFYMNELRSAPKGDFIDVIHKEWWGKYELLEKHHGYIQWLFPIMSGGSNPDAQPLRTHEIEAIKTSPAAQKRVMKSYEMILDFYGVELVSRERGDVRRAKQWRIRYRHLNKSHHNYLRITRILTSLGELGFGAHQFALAEFFMDEIFVKKKLSNIAKSFEDYWLHTLDNSSLKQYLMSQMPKRSKTCNLM